MYSIYHRRVCQSQFPYSPASEEIGAPPGVCTLLAARDLALSPPVCLAAVYHATIVIVAS